MNQTAIRGFTLRQTTYIEELNANAHLMEHDRSGARLFWLEREDENMTFGIAFRTLPWDDTGVFHILEHSVLCGSEKYPVREPFVELMKGSLNTFLNALTFPDKTFYPISSRNTADFLNLTRVYLDAVLHPLIDRKPEIFMQEGWHYEIPEDGAPTYSGVVFNEMKGDFASADSIMDREMNRRLFPDNCYRFVSGGDPSAIPDLTYEAFVESHRRFYHPSNSYLFLDGSIEEEATFALLNEYLDGYERQAPSEEIKFQPPVDGGTARVSYELGEDESEEGRTRLGLGYVVGRYDDTETLAALSVLSDVLTGSNHAPLTRRILSEGLAEDMIMSSVTEVLQPYVIFEADNLREEDLDRTAETILDELRRISEEGLDRTQLEASLSNLEFRMRERDYGTTPRGLVFGFEALNYWLYGGNPAEGLSIGTLFEDLRRKADEGYFEDLLRRVILENPHRCRVELIPSHTVGAELRAAEEARLMREQAEWTEEQRQALLEQNARLAQWQQTPDTPEQLATIPHITLDEISEHPMQIPTEIQTHHGLTVLSHPISTSGIVYAGLFFDLDGRSEEELCVMSFALKLLGNLETEHYSCQELQSAMRLTMGSLSAGISPFGKINEPNRCQVKLRVVFSALEHKLADAVELVTEILLRTRWKDTELIRKVLKQKKTALQEEFVMSGAGKAVTRVSAATSAAGVVDECTGGLYYYRWLKQAEEQLDVDAEQFAEKLAESLRHVFSVSNVTLSITGRMEQGAERMAELFAAKLPQMPVRKGDCTIRPWGRKREGIVIPADVSFAVRGGSLLNHGGMYSCKAALACRIASLEYLWNVIRVQGGAYGAGMPVRDSGALCCYSYRDPNGKQSLERYCEAGDRLRAYLKEKPDLTGAIIGAISDSSPILTPRLTGLMGDLFYWRGITYEHRCRERSELLCTTCEELEALCPVLTETVEQGSICIFGVRNQIEECGALLDSVEVL